MTLSLITNNYSDTETTTINCHHMSKVNGFIASHVLEVGINLDSDFSGPVLRVHCVSLQGYQSNH